MRYGREHPSFGFNGPRPGGTKPTGMPGVTRESAITIGELNDATKTLVEQSFGHFWVRGEVVDFKPHRNGHWYFCLRDASAQIACVVWSRDQCNVPAPPDDGMQVLAQVQMTMFAARGTLQLKVIRIEAEGEGLWRKAMELTIERLHAEGLTAEERKKPIPRFPRCIAVVTSPSGAALRDIISVARRRRPGVRIIVCPAAVQGESAPAELCAAIARVELWGGADVLIVGRGGGSREDLWAFNEERVARAIAACAIPVISAVGHEIDISVCDLVADLRAATPSVAAEAAVPALADLVAVLRAQRSRIASAAQQRTASAQLNIRTAARDMRGAAIRCTERRRLEVAGTAGRLNALSPLATLARGYAVARSSGGETLSSVAQFSPGDEFTLVLRDGTVRAEARGLFLACSAQATMSPDRISGTFHLETVNGASLPAVIDRSVVKVGNATETTTIETLSAVLTLNPDGMFTNVARIRTTRGLQVDTTSATSVGRYELKGETLTLFIDVGDAPVAGNTFVGTITADGGMLSGLSGLGRTYVYQRIVPR